MKAQEATGSGGDGVRQVPPRWRQRVGGLTGIAALIEALNVEPSVVLDSARIERVALEDADNWIGYDAFGRLLENAANTAGYPHFGLTAGRMWHLEDFGALGELARHSATVADAIQALSQYQHVQGEGGLLYTARHGSLMEVGYAIYYPGVAGADQIYDFALAGIFNVLRELCGPAWMPAQVLIPHAKPQDPVHFRNLFKVMPRFDSEVCAVHFPAQWLDRPLDGVDPERRNAALAQVHGKDEPDLMQQAYRALRGALLSGSSSGNDVARALGMHRRTLNRRLQQGGTTFQSVLDDVRCEAARQLLCYSDVGLDDIAASLAYAGVSPFMRSFRRWTGLTPGVVRRRAVDGPGTLDASLAAAGDRLPRGEQSRRTAGMERLGDGAAGPAFRDAAIARATLLQEAKPQWGDGSASLGAWRARKPVALGGVAD